MLSQTKRWFTWDNTREPDFSAFLARMRDRGWWYLGSATPVVTADGVDCQFVWDDDRGDPPAY